MTEIKDDRYYLQRMLHYAELIVAYYKALKEHGKNMTADDQESDGIIFKFNQLREEAKHLSSHLLSQHQDLAKQVTMLIRFRNRVIHDYENVKYSFFDEIVTNDIPALINTLKLILSA